MKSGKQRRAEIKQARLGRARKRAQHEAKPKRPPFPLYCIRCNPEKLAPYNSYGCPDYVARGYYEDLPFECIDCGADEIWRATQQKWWYEVAKGDVWTTARRCRKCRRKERERKSEARRVHLEGVAAKAREADDRS